MCWESFIRKFFLARGYILNRISEITKRDIFDLFKNGFNIEVTVGNHPEFQNYPMFKEETIHMDYWGRLEEIEFLERIYNLDKMESTDSRFDNAKGDIWQHTINNNDWECFWVFSDPRFKLKNGEDKYFLDFICEVFHPVVIANNTSWKTFLDEINRLLKFDGYEIVEGSKVSGRVVYTWKSETQNKIIQNQLGDIKKNFSSDYVNNQIDTMNKLITDSPNTAIGKAKELLETCCKSILDEYEEDYNDDIKLIQLMKKTLDVLDLTPKNIDKENKYKNIASQILGNLCNISDGMGQLRNLYGGGHGKSKYYQELPSRYAHLAVGTSATAVHFIWETHLDRMRNKNN